MHSHDTFPTNSSNMNSVRNDERYRRESACVFTKGTGQTGVQSEWVETTLGRRNSDWEVSVRVFDVSTTNLIYPMNHVCEDIVFTWQPSPQPSISVFLYPHQWETSKSPDILGCLVFSWWWFTVHTPSHVSSDVYTFMYPLETVCQRCGPLVLHAL